MNSYVFNNVKWRDNFGHVFHFLRLMYAMCSNGAERSGNEKMNYMHIFIRKTCIFARTLIPFLVKLLFFKAI